MTEPLPAIATSQPRTIPGFSVKLEALRGLAALMVVGFHVFPDPWTKILFNGGAAVVLFFVLSGYVLGLSLRRGTGTMLQQSSQFLWRRIFRIYPAYFATTLAFWIYWQWYPFQGGAWVSHSFFETLQINPLHQIGNFLFLDQSINPVTWSLKVEMAGSILLPFLHFLSQKLRWRGWMALLAGLVLLGFAPGDGNTRRSLYMFYLGYLIADIEHLPKFSNRVYSLITGVAVVTFLTGHCVRESCGMPCELLIEAVSAAGIILCLQAGGGSLGGILNHPWTHFCGRVSYSLFLSHWMTLDVAGQLLHRSPLQTIFQHCPAYLAVWLRLLVSLPLVLLVSAALYRWIETPFIKLGKTRGPAALWRTIKAA